MKLYGMEKYSLVDYDGYVACTVFTGGCNFRCPFCHNAALVTGVAGLDALEEADVFAYLTSRKGLVDAVCVTGGEPTLHRDLPLFVHEVRHLGYRVKLDTNGTNPDMLEGLLSAGMLDYVAMDVKNDLENYDRTAGVKVDQALIDRSISLLMAGKCDYEFRTTVLNGYHTVEGIRAIAQRIAGAKQYYIQCFEDKGGNLTAGLEGLDEATVRQMCEVARPYVQKAAVRGL